MQVYYQSIHPLQLSLAQIYYLSLSSSPRSGVLGFYVTVMTRQHVLQTLLLGLVSFRDLSTTRQIQ